FANASSCFFHPTTGQEARHGTVLLERGSAFFTNPGRLFAAFPQHLARHTHALGPYSLGRISAGVRQWRPQPCWLFLPRSRCTATADLERERPKSGWTRGELVRPVQGV